MKDWAASGARGALSHDFSPRIWTLLSIILQKDFGMGGERTQFHSLYSHFAAETLKHGVQLQRFFVGSCSTPVHPANIHRTPALSKASCTEGQQRGILTTKAGQACLYPATVAMAPTTPERG